MDRKRILWAAGDITETSTLVPLASRLRRRSECSVLLTRSLHVGTWTVPKSLPRCNEQWISCGYGASPEADGVGGCQGHKGRSDDQSRDADQVTTRADCSKSLGVGDRSNCLVARCGRRVSGASGRGRPGSAGLLPSRRLQGRRSFHRAANGLLRGCLPCKPEPVSVARRLEQGARDCICAEPEKRHVSNIKTLHNFKPSASEEEIRASALQFVRKLSGFRGPPRRTRSLSTRRSTSRPGGAQLLDSLVTRAPPRDRECRSGEGPCEVRRTGSATPRRAALIEIVVQDLRPSVIKPPSEHVERDESLACR